MAGSILPDHWCHRGAEQRLAADCLQRPLLPCSRYRLAPLAQRRRRPGRLSSADATRRQAAGAASCRACPRRHRVRNRGWVTPRTAYRAMVPFAFDTGPRSGLCYASFPLDTCRACLQTGRHMLTCKRCVWCRARRPWRRMGRDGRRRSLRVRSCRCRPALSRRARRGWRQ